MTNLERSAMDRIARLFVELRDGLLEAAQECARSDQPDWDRAEHFFSGSKRVDALCRSILSSPSTEHPNGEVPTPADVADAIQTHVQRSSTGRKSRKDYPKWSVRGDVLSKVGLSRDRKTEYEHLVPRKEFDAIMTQLVANAGRRHFTAEEVIEQVSAPSYQVYIVLSLLKEHGVLAVPRRGMYAFSRAKNFVNEVESIWRSLGNKQSES